ncbi:MAG: glycoside hydrolase family 2 protein, partial [Lachnospiraceae bacterium]|nr:glycoside hydrolase family 2 protein [Lachnospiraceae bacterium]
MMMKDMTTGWKMHQVGENSWFPASVPGTVYTDLLENGQMEDPFWKDNENKALALMEKDYEYETVFQCDELRKSKKVWLRFEGLDTIADVYVNEKHVGNAENMHRIWEYDVTDVLTDGDNTLRVYFHSPLQYIKEAYAKQPTRGSEDAMDGFVHIRKAHCMFGWDWGAHLPDA